MKRKKGGWGGGGRGGKGNMSTKQLVDLWVGRRSKTKTVLFLTRVLLSDPFARFVFGFVYARDLNYSGIDLLLRLLEFSPSQPAHEPICSLFF